MSRRERYDPESSWPDPAPIMRPFTARDYASTVIAKQDGQSVVFTCEGCGAEAAFALAESTTRLAAQFTAEHILSRGRKP